MLDYAIEEHKGPIAIRYPKGRCDFKENNGEFVLSKATVIREGKDITIVSEGQSVSLAASAAEILSKRGIEAEVIDLRTLKPIDFDSVFKSAAKTGNLLSIEENLRRGGMGEMLAGEAKLRNLDFKMCIKALEDEFVVHGSIEDIKDKYGFTPEQVALQVERMLK